ncbi:hypothetical protein CAMRE0001_0144 [Campylobacter rectus RM3267]|uniref:Uncharacterized protein n=1 Tax=Campylobacter rectus RM3267 TaxID=553218 RepID=B9CXV4_CAMRE|nr:hypothetical protein CAMRE0001_0144 [Campylobacter rectus RM3267]
MKFYHFGLCFRSSRLFKFYRLSFVCTHAAQVLHARSNSRCSAQARCADKF